MANDSVGCPLLVAVGVSASGTYLTIIMFKLVNTTIVSLLKITEALVSLCYVGFGAGL